MKFKPFVIKNVAAEKMDLERYGHSVSWADYTWKIYTDGFGMYHMKEVRPYDHRPKMGDSFSRMEIADVQNRIRQGQFIVIPESPQSIIKKRNAISLAEYYKQKEKLQNHEK